MPASAIYTATDPSEYSSLIRGEDVKVLVTDKGDFRAKLTRIDLHSLWLQRGQENMPRVFCYVPLASRVVISFPTETSCPVIRLGGVETSSRQIILLRPGEQSPSRSLGASQWCSMSLPSKDFALWGRALTGREVAPPEFTHALSPPRSLMSRLQQLHGFAGHLAETSPGVIAEPEAARNLEHALIEAMFGCIAGIAADDPVTTRHHREIMVRFEALLEANPERAVSMPEVCAKIGVAGRTLRACCSELLGVGPKQYLHLRRMQLAHQALLRANPDAVTVTQVATRYGFWELGRFAVAYRSLFGQSPRSR